MSLARNIVINSQPNASIAAYTGSPTSFTINANSNKALYYNVTNNGDTEYVFSGDVTGNNPVLNVLLGDSLTFYVNASGHPFYVKTANTTGSGNVVSSSQIFGPSQIVISGGSSSYNGVYTRVATDYNWNTSNNTIVTGNGRDAYFNALTNVGIIYDNTSNWYVVEGVDLVNGTDLVPSVTALTPWTLGQSGIIDYPTGAGGATYGTATFYSSSGNGVATGSFTWTPLSIGTYYYNCGNHAAMYGTINVLTPPTISYDWRKAESTSPSTFVSIPVQTGSGQGTATYTTEVLDENADNGDKYRCVLSAPLGSNSPLTSSTYTLSVTTPVITITQQPTNVTSNPGLFLTFTVAASVTSPFAITYQWQKRSVDNATWNAISGATASSLTVPNLENGDIIRCIVTSVGAVPVTSNQATVTLIPFALTTATLPNPQVVDFTEAYTSYTSYLYTSDPVVADAADNYTLLEPFIWAFTGAIQQASSIYSIATSSEYPIANNYTFTNLEVDNFYPCPVCPPPSPGGGSTRPTEGLIVPRYGL